MVTIFLTQKTIAMADNKPCPFCGHQDHFPITRMSSHGYAFLCANCDAVGPKFRLPNIGEKGMSLKDYDIKLRQQAIDAWNKRVKK